MDQFNDPTTASALCPQPSHNTSVPHDDPAYCSGHCAYVEAHPGQPHECNACGQSYGMG